MKSVWRSFSCLTKFFGAVPGGTLGEELLAVDGAKGAQRAAVYGVFGPLDPTGVYGTVHLVHNPGFVHRLDDRVGGLDAAAQGLVEVDVLARLGARDGDDAPPLDAGAHADDVDVGPRHRLVDIADVRDVVVVSELLVELVSHLRRVRLVGDGNEAAARVLGEDGGMALLVGALAAYEQNAELRHGTTLTPRGTGRRDCRGA